MAALGGLPDHAEQDVLFILEPLGGLSGACDSRQRDTRLPRSPANLVMAGIKETRSRGGSVQVVIEHAVHRAAPVGFVLTAARLLRRVGTQQVMTGEAAGNMLREQVLVAQLRQLPGSSVVATGQLGSPPPQP